MLKQIWYLLQEKYQERLIPIIVLFIILLISFMLLCYYLGYNDGVFAANVWWANYSSSSNDFIWVVR